VKLERSEWRHPGGKLRDKGAESLTDAELLATRFPRVIKGMSAEEIAEKYATLDEVREKLR